MFSLVSRLTHRLRFPLSEAVNLRRITIKLARPNLTEAAREAAALKAQFRREDEELYRQGRGAEVLSDRMKVLGITDSGSTRLLTVNGVRIKP